MNNSDLPLILPRKLTQQLLALAQMTPDQEICGLIGARNDIPCQCYPVPNQAHIPETQYQMAPDAQIATLKTLRERGETLFAIYHSHPTSPAWPSSKDLRQANYPDCLYLIISLATKGVLEIRGFWLNEGTVTEQRLAFGH
ncbi:MAG: M67 family metallopeptidase [Methylococcales bacterium]|nr:M67 family metallopeptidase [Methylococcales bacterium]